MIDNSYKKVFEEESLIWFNGDFVKYKDANFVHVASHSLHYSSSIFEGIISFDGKVFELPYHAKRFFSSARSLGMSLFMQEEDLVEIINQVIKKNGYVKDLYYIRPLAWRDVEDATIKGYKDAPAHVAVMARKHSNSLNKDIPPVKLLISSWKKPPTACMPHQAKGAGNYLIPILGKQEAVKHGLDDVLLIDCDGFIAEGGSANSFFVRGKSIFTPYPVHCLNGVTRQNIMNLAASKGYKVEEANITIDELENFDEVFLTGTAVGVLAVQSIKLSEKTTVEFDKFETTTLLKKLYKERVIAFS